MRKTNAVLLKEARSALKNAEAANVQMAEDLAAARATNRNLNQAAVTRQADDATRSFRTVEIRVFNEKGKQSSNQCFGIGEGGRMRFEVSDSGGVSADTFMPEKPQA